MERQGLDERECFFIDQIQFGIGTRFTGSHTGRTTAVQGKTCEMKLIAATDTVPAALWPKVD